MDNDIKECKLVEKIFIRNRWHVKIEPSFNGRKTFPLAQYNWLKGNPAFKEIPFGYVIHHLDHDELNDDISNLVLMQKHHHAAYHWKHKIIDSEVKINIDYRRNERSEFYPTREPRIYKRSDGKAYFLDIRETIEGKRVKTRITRFKGEVIRNIKTATKFKELIWPYSQVII